MSSGVDVRCDTAELQKLLARFRDRGGDLTPTMQIVAETLVGAVNDEFESAGRGRWAPLAESTLRKRRMSGSGAQILKDTGRFAGSIRGDSGSDWAEASTDVAYAVYHVSEEPRSVIPLRNPFDVPDAILDEVTQIIVDDVTAELEAA